MVFRSDPGKFKDLKHEFGEFLKRVTYLVDDLMRNIEVMDLQVMIGEVCNWQVWYILLMIVFWIFGLFYAFFLSYVYMYTHIWSIISLISQETATCFVNRLSDEYAAYTDIIQPVQVAVYEMKLGLSLVLSSSLQKGFQNRVMQDNMDGILVGYGSMDISSLSSSSQLLTWRGLYGRQQFILSSDSQETMQANPLLLRSNLSFLRMVWVLLQMFGHWIWMC